MCKTAAHSHSHCNLCVLIEFRSSRDRFVDGAALTLRECWKRFFFSSLNNRVEKFFQDAKNKIAAAADPIVRSAYRRTPSETGDVFAGLCIHHLIRWSIVAPCGACKCVITTPKRHRENRRRKKPFASVLHSPSPSSSSSSSFSLCSVCWRKEKKRLVVMYANSTRATHAQLFPSLLLTHSLVWSSDQSIDQWAMFSPIQKASEQIVSFDSTGPTLRRRARWLWKGFRVRCWNLLYAR